MFFLHFCYNNHREVTDQVTVDTKVLSFTSDRLTFKGSLCFLPFPLSSFPSTFGIQELTKGFFPHLFNTLENQEYEGPLPDASHYDPDGMSQKKKAEFLRRHAQKVQDSYISNLCRDMEVYCVSDVKLLKARFRKFREEFKKKADFDPLEKCITVASSCNRFWPKKLLQPNTIASEPPRGWHGARTNHSMIAFKWLAWCEHQLRNQHTSSSPSTDNILYAANGGEQRVANFLVDGFAAFTNTVYELHGCLWHGCPRCHPPPHRYQHSKLHPEGTLQEMYEATQKKTQKTSRRWVYSYRSVGVRLGS